MHVDDFGEIKHNFKSSLVMILLTHPILSANKAQEKEAPKATNETQLPNMVSYKLF
jgi:hypothetical protein